MNEKARSGAYYLILVFALVAACLLYATVWSSYSRTSAQTSNGHSNGLIAFSTNRNGVPGEIYVMNPDGSGQHNLTNSPASDTRPDCRI